MADEMTDLQSGHPGHRRREKSRNGILVLRNVLNIIFMLVAIAGVITYMTVDKEIGMYIVLVSIPFKITESAIRMLRI